MTTPSERDVLLEKYGSVAGARITEPSSNFVPMLAALSEVPFTKTGWIYEPKMDGIRGITVTASGKCKVLSRRNLDLTSQYPGIASELPALLSVDAVLDGEIIALNETGRPSFQHLQQRMNLTRETDVLRAEQLVPAYYFVFDVIQVGRVSLLGVKLAERKKILGEILQQSPRIKLLQHFDDDGVLAYHACVENGFEGIVAKRLDSYYEPGRRSPSWIKLKANQTAEFVLGGYTPGDGWRSETFGSLLLGYYDDNGKLHYAGSVGSGFDDRLLHETMRRIAPLRSTKCPFIKKPADKRDALWLEPGVIVEVKFMDWTRDGHLRTPVFLRFRDDKVVSEIRREKSVQPLSTQSAAAVVSTPGELDTLPPENNVARIVPLLSVAESPVEYTAQTAQDQKPLSLVPAETALLRSAGEPLAVQKQCIVLNEVAEVLSQLSGKEKKFELLVQRERIGLTHLDKILWPATEKHDVITKRDFLRTIAELSPYLLGYLYRRPLTLVRSPDGVRGKRFYQKHWNFAPPEFMDSVRVADSEEETGFEEYLLCDNLATLMFLAQNGVVEYHTFVSSVQPQHQHFSTPDANIMHGPDGTLIPEVEAALDYPDQLVFDVDLHVQTERVKARPLDDGAFDKTRAAAFLLRDVFLSMGLRPYVKTSGKNGIHVVLPIVRNAEFDVVRFVADTIRQFMGNAHREMIALDSDSSRKYGRVFLDHGPNGRGRTVVAAYSPRFAPEATLSCPISWQELEFIKPDDFHLMNIAERLKKSGDAWAGMFDEPYDLHTVFRKK